jgi:hypothetical protein
VSEETVAVSSFGGGEEEEEGGVVAMMWKFVLYCVVFRV